MRSSISHQKYSEGEATPILTVGIDLAKHVFALHSVNEAGKVELVRPAVQRNKLHALIYAMLNNGDAYTDVGKDYFEKR